MSDLDNEIRKEILDLDLRFDLSIDLVPLLCLAFSGEPLHQSLVFPHHFGLCGEPTVRESLAFLHHLASCGVPSVKHLLRYLFGFLRCATCRTLASVIGF